MSTLEERAIGRAQVVAMDPAVRPEVSRVVVDALSVALAGCGNPRVRRLASTLGVARGAGAPGLAAVWFSGASAPAAQAALLNGMAIHVDDFDDTHDAAIVHAMSAILPAAFAGAELVPSDGSRVAAAVAAGTELACNLALTRGRYAGWHYTTLCGTLGAALACAVAAGADGELVAAAVGNAYVYAAGNKQAVLDSSPMKRTMPGFAAQSGVLAYQAATAGLNGVDSWFSGAYGLHQLFFEGLGRLDQVDGGPLARVAELSLKPYPACRFTHGAIEAAMWLWERSVAPGPVSVHYPATDRFGIVCRPFERRGATEMDAQFSTAFLVSAVLAHGPVTFETFRPELLESSALERAARSVTVSCDIVVADDATLGPIEVRVGDEAERVNVVLGSPERPLAATDQQAKLASCVQRLDRLVGTDLAATGLSERLGAAVAALEHDGGGAAIELVRTPYATAPF